MKVSSKQIHNVAQLLFRHLAGLGQGEFEISKDFYWEIPAEARYDQYEKPSDLTIGQLSDDWTELEGLLSGDKDPVGYGLVWLGNILRAIGEETQG
jgi:hypothetical protein